VFVHGWAFDAGFWDPLRKLLSAWPQQALDMGYYTSGQAQLELPAGPLVMIGHSYGYMHALAHAPAQVRAWVSINGFTRFCAGPGFPHGVTPRILQRMAARLQASPAAVVDDFRQRCGAGSADKEPDPQALACGLDAMLTQDFRSRARQRTSPLLVMAGEADPIVTQGMTRDAFEGCDIAWAPGEGHLLPLSNPAWCAARIIGFLAAQGLGFPAGRETPKHAGVSARFGAAAARYERHAGVQRMVADRLAARIARLSLPARPRILEIGCGTGVFTRRLAACFPQADWTITDLSPAMLAQARQNVQLGEKAHFEVMDGEHPEIKLRNAEGFDLICSSMAMQWFRDPGKGLARLAELLAPSGCLAMAAPVQGTFAEWRKAHEALGLPAAVIQFPQAAALHPQGLPNISGDVQVEAFVDECGSAIAFLRDLKGIGATMPRAGSRPLSVPQLRQVCARFEQTGARCSYQIAFSLWRRAAPGDLDSEQSKRNMADIRMPA
jgi:malonyl-CoA O-methyltransferase